MAKNWAFRSHTIHKIFKLVKQETQLAYLRGVFDILILWKYPNA